MAAPLLSPTEQLKQLRVQRIAAARRGFASFCELVLTDEESQRPLVLAPFHRTWARLLRAQRRLMIWSFVGSGKTSILSVAYVLWSLGNNANLRIAILRNGEEQAREVIRLLARHIQQNELLHAVFPHLKPAQGGPWNESAVTVERSGFAKDASVRAYGIGSNIYGARIQLLIADDVVDNANSMTQAPRDGVAAKFFRECQSRLVGSENPQLVVIGTPFHKDDLYHRLLALGSLPLFKFPILDDSGSPQWPSRWPAEKIEQARRDVPPAEAARSLDLLIVDPASAVFRDEWLLNAIARGGHHTTLTRCPTGWGLTHRPLGTRIAVGVDPASSLRTDADLSAISAVLRHPDGTMELLEVQAGHWGSPDLVSRILDANRRFAPDSLVVESVAFQQSLSQWVRHFDGLAHVVPYKTNAHALNLRNRVGDMEVALQNGKWSFPSVAGLVRDRETDALVRDLRFFCRQDHVPDRLTATMLAAWGLDQALRNRIETGALDTMSR